MILKDCRFNDDDDDRSMYLIVVKRRIFLVKKQTGKDSASNSDSLSMYLNLRRFQTFFVFFGKNLYNFYLHQERHKYINRKKTKQ